MDSAGGFCRRATESREKLASFLGVGRSLFFRDFQRFPWFFGAILFIFVALGCALSSFLLLVPMPVIAVPLKDLFRDIMMDSITAIIPAYDLILLDLSWVQRAFSENGEFSGAINLIVNAGCIAFGFYGFTVPILESEAGLEAIGMEGTATAIPPDGNREIGNQLT